jgi:hypothetical protein
MSIAKKQPKRQAARDATMRAKGMVLAADVARVTGYHISTVHRWMDDGKVAGKKVDGTRRYITLASITAFLGEATAKKLSLTGPPPDPAEFPEEHGEAAEETPAEEGA